jgi:hypothetical protein
LGTILGGVNMITIVVCLRAPGMTMFRMPVFTWNILVTSIMVLVAFPLLKAALFGLSADRTRARQLHCRRAVDLAGWCWARNRWRRGIRGRRAFLRQPIFATPTRDFDRELRRRFEAVMTKSPVRGSMASWIRSIRKRE